MADVVSEACFTVMTGDHGLLPVIRLINFVNFASESKVELLKTGVDSKV